MDNTFLQKRRIFLKSLFFYIIVLPLIVFTIIFFFTHKSFKTEAQVAKFYPETCLGGWSNSDRAAGSPDVAAGAVEFSDENSASLSDSSGQIFCGGFDGQIPENARHNRVVLSIAFGVEQVVEEKESVPQEQEFDTEVKEEEKESSSENVIEVQSPEQQDVEEKPAEDSVEEEIDQTGEVLGEETSEAEANEEINDENMLEEAASEETSTPEIEEKPVESETSEEPAPAETTSFWKKILPVAYAEESAAEDVDMSEVPPGSVFAVKYTLDGSNWSTLGHVSDITSTAVFDLPVGIFATIEDLKKTQISIETIPTSDNLPKIYIDAMWLDIEYVDPVTDPLVPPGEMPGDVILGEIPYENMTAVLVERSPEDENTLLELWMYVFAEETAFVDTLATQELVVEEVVGVDDLENEDTIFSQQGSEENETSVSENIEEITDSLGSTEAVDKSTITEMEKELSVNVIEETRKKIWVKIAGDELLSRKPNVAYLEGSVYWIGSGDSAIWKFNPISNSFESTSFNPGETGKLYIYDREDGSKFVERQSDGSIKLKEIKKLNNGT